MPVAIHHEESACQLAGERIAGIHAQHEIRREISAPGTRVVEIIFGVERIVADEAAEDPALHGEAFAHWRKIRDIRRTKMAQPLPARKVRSSCRESEDL